MLVLKGLLMEPPEKIPPSGDFTTPTWMLNIYAAGEMLKASAGEEAVSEIAGLATPAPVTCTVRPRPVDLKGLTGGKRGGTAYKFRVLSAQPDAERKAR